jgi:tetratricopeptide (TPR) repeat protein
MMQWLFAWRRPTLLAALAVVAMLPVTWAAFLWDDHILTGTSALRSRGGLWQIWSDPGAIPGEGHYWPVTYSSFWLEHQLWGMQSFSCHVVNLALHAVASILLWRVLQRLGVGNAWLAAALFAVHPIHVESVAWAIERKDVLCGALFLAAMLQWLKASDRESTAAFPPLRPYAVSMVLFLGALFSKSMAVSLPPILLVARWWQAGRVSRRDVLAVLPFAIVAVTVTCFDLSLHRRANGGADLIGSALGPLSRLLAASGAVLFSLGKLAWPWPLSPFYPIWNVSPTSLEAWLPPAGLVAMLSAAWAARVWLGRGPFAALLAYALALAPASGIVDFGFLRFSWIADRFQYLASAAPLAVGAAAVSAGGAALGLTGPLRHTGAAALLLVLGCLSFTQARLYHSPTMLLEHARACVPDSWAATYFLGWDCRERGQYERALALLRQAQEMAPRPEAHLASELAMVEDALALTEEADRDFRRALELNPDLPHTLVNYGAFVARRGRLEEAVALYGRALQLRPDYPSALNNLATALARLGRMTEAERAATAAVAAAPTQPQVRSNRGFILMQLGRAEEAERDCRMALQSNPGDPRASSTLGQLLFARQAYAEAAIYLGVAARARPADAGAHFQLGEARRLSHDVAGAVAAYRAAVGIDPGFTRAAERLKQLE